MTTMKVRLTFTEEVLGTASANPEIHSEFIASKAPDAQSREEEIAAIGVDEAVEKQKTVFPKENGKPFIWDYQIKGFFKDAAQAFNYIGGAYKLSNYKKKIDDLVFIDERKVFYQMPEKTEIGDCQRPLRADTAQGPRVALANSDTAPEGSTLTFTIRVLVDDLMDYIVEYRNYGQLKGIGAWRNSGKGRLTWEELDDNGNVIPKRSGIDVEARKAAKKAAKGGKNDTR